jgi:hypothetical protein
MAVLSGKTLKQTKQLIITSVLFCVLAGVQPLLWSFVHASAEALHNKRTLERQYANVQERIAQIDEARSRQDPLLQQLTAVFPIRGTTSQLVERLEQLGDRNRVIVEIREIAEEAPLTTRGQVDLIPFVITLRATGTPAQLFEYLDAVEHAPEAIVVRSWSLDNPDASPLYRLTMAVVFHLQE